MAHSSSSMESTTVARPTRLPSYLNIFNVFGTLRLVGALIRDRRLTFLRRGFFGIITLLLAVIVLVPSNPLALLIAAAVPVVGPILDLPADYTIDWVAAAAIITVLVRMFPREIVAEHTARIYGSTK